MFKDESALRLSLSIIVLVGFDLCNLARVMEEGIDRINGDTSLNSNHLDPHKREASPEINDNSLVEDSVEYCY